MTYEDNEVPGLDLIYVGEIPRCPVCHMQDILFLGNESRDLWVPGKSWFKCQADGTVFSTRPEVPPRYRYANKK